MSKYLKFLTIILLIAVANCAFSQEFVIPSLDTIGYDSAPDEFQGSSFIIPEPPETPVITSAQGTGTGIRQVSGTIPPYESRIPSYNELPPQPQVRSTPLPYDRQPEPLPENYSSNGQNQVYPQPGNTQPNNNYPQSNYPQPYQPQPSNYTPENDRLQFPAPGNNLDIPDNRLQPGMIQPSPLRTEEEPKLISRPVVIDVKYLGTGQIPLSKIRALVKTRKDRPYSGVQIEEDKRALMQTNWFRDVKTTVQRYPEGRVVTFEMIGLPLLHYVKFVGNKKFSKAKLLEESQLIVNETLDPMMVRQAKERLESLYKSSGMNNIHIEIIRGDSITDKGAVFWVDEGSMQKIYKTEIIGADSGIVSESRLKTQVTSKPGFLLLIGGTFTRKQLDQDIETLTKYYRDLGYYHAQVDADFSEGESFNLFGTKRSWITVRFIIQEGPRCIVNSISFQGNKIYNEKEFLEVMKTKPGAFFSGPRLAQDSVKLKDMYGDIGHVFAKIQPDMILDEDRIDLVYTIDEGKRARISIVDVEIVGKDGAEPYTKLTSVFDILSNRLRPGATMDLSQIKASQRALNYSSIFNTNPSQGLTPTIEYHEIENEAEMQDDFEMNAGNPGYRGQTYEREAADSFAGIPSFPTLGGETYRLIMDEIPTYRPVRSRDVRQEIPRYEPLNIPQNNQRNSYDDEIPVYRGQAPDRSRQTAAVTFDDEIPPYRPISFPNNSANNVTNYEPTMIRGQSSRTMPPMQKTTTSNGSPLSWEAAPVVQAPANPNTDLYITQDSNANTRAYSASPYNPNQTLVTTNYPQAGSQIYDESMASQPVSQYGTIGVQSPTYYGYQENNQANASQGQYQQVAYDNGRPLFAPPQPYIPWGGNPSTNAGGFADAVMPGSRENDAYNRMRNNPSKFVDVPVKVRVGETQTGIIQASIGVNSDIGLQGMIKLEERNFDIFKLPKSFFRVEDWRNAFRGGNQLFRIEASPGQNYSRYEATWQQPYLFHTNFSFGVSGFYYNRYYDEWKEDRLGGNLSLGYSLTPDLRLNMFLGAQNIEIHNRIDPMPPDLEKVLGKNEMYTAGINLTHDTRDSRYLASEGHSYSFGVEHAMGTWNFTRANYDLRKYFTLWERADTSGRWILGLRSAAGITESGTPIYERYYGGGFSSIRGFEYRGVSPRWGSSSIGGCFEFYNSAELIFPITADDMVRGVVFVDSGTVESKISKWDQNYRVTAGFGLRITIPMMGPVPIAFDFAFPLSKDPMDQTQVFAFSITGTR